jgi:SAM-dependent methyltransferase
MGSRALASLSAPASVLTSRGPSDEAGQERWEDELVAFFSKHYEVFTPFPGYFRTRTLEFRAMRQLLPEYFDWHARYGRALELGCGYGYKTALLAPFAREILGIDIPEKYRGYVRGDFATSTQIAESVHRNLLQLEGSRFRAMWPTELDLPDEAFSLIFSEYVLEHIPDLRDAVVEMERVLAPGGVMIHVVPITTDMFFAYTKAQLEGRLRDTVKGLARRVLRKSTRIAGTGAVSPPLHSEFAHSFAHQLKIYSLESYLFPLLERGLRVERVLQTREHNRVIVVRKPARAESA